MSLETPDRFHAAANLRVGTVPILLDNEVQVLRSENFGDPAFFDPLDNAAVFMPFVQPVAPENAVCWIKPTGPNSAEQLCLVTPIETGVPLIDAQGPGVIFVADFTTPDEYLGIGVYEIEPTPGPVVTLQFAP